MAWMRHLKPTTPVSAFCLVVSVWVNVARLMLRGRATAWTAFTGVMRVLTVTRAPTSTGTSLPVFPPLPAVGRPPPWMGL